MPVANKAGARTMRHGWQQVRRGLLAPPVLIIVATILILETAALIAIPWIARSFGVHTNTGLESFVSGAVIATTIIVLLAFAAILAGGVNWFTGASAERATAELFAHLGPDWKAVHNLVFVEGKPPNTWVVDVDHVAVGPSGVLVIESKYSTQAIDIDAPRLSKQLRNDAAQVAQNAVRVKRLLALNEMSVPIRPILVYWGWRVRSTKTPIREMGRVWVVMGAEVHRWKSRLTEAKADGKAVDAAWFALVEHASDFGSN
jgi:hypothetical protein